MVLQVLDLVNSNEQFYGDCPINTYTDLDVNSSGHTTCTIVPTGKILLILFDLFVDFVNVSNHILIPYIITSNYLLKLYRKYKYLVLVTNFY